MKVLKAKLATRFRAIVNVYGKDIIFSKTSDTEQGLINAIKEHGMSISHIVKFESFKVSTEKRRGKMARKY